MPVKPFVLIVVDKDRGTFCVEGPMSDDTKWNSAVCAEQDKGRQVNCHTPGEPERSNVEKAAQAYAAQYGYERRPAGSIVPRPGAL